MSVAPEQWFHGDYRYRCPNAFALFRLASRREWDLADGDRRDRVREVRQTAELALGFKMDIPADLVPWYESEMEPRTGDAVWPGVAL